MKQIKYIFSTLFLAIIIVSCSQESHIGNNQGYLTINVSSLVSTNDPNTRASAPAGYDPKTLYVAIKDQNGKVVKSTSSYAEDSEFQAPILLEKGTYTIVAHSAGWDGSGSGFNTPYYYGSTDVTVRAKYIVKANVVCTQANVKITVNYDESFLQNFKSAKTTILHKDLTVDEKLEFIMRETTQSAYIPAGDFTATLGVVNNKNVPNTHTQSFVDAKPRDHYILNYKLKDDGYLGSNAGSGVVVEVDESTNTYTFAFDVPRKSSISLATSTPNAWSTFAYLNARVTAKTSDFDYAGLTMEWRRFGEADWTIIDNQELVVDKDEDNISARLAGLTENTTYEYRLCYKKGDAEVSSGELTFTTEPQTAIYNGGFENWWTSGKIEYPNEQGVTYWDTSNPGGASFGGSNTTATTEKVHGGLKAAKLESKYIVIKFAAASLYTGKFGALVGTNGAWLNWGVPFTSRPTALKGWMQYAPKAINKIGSNLPAGTPGKGEMDQCGMFCVLLTESLVVDNTKMDEFPDFETDSRVVAYGSLPTEQNVDSNGEWKEVNIPLVYRSLTKKPTHMLIVFSASKYGDYFHGGEGSTLYLDDFCFEYGDQPSVMQ